MKLRKLNAKGFSHDIVIVFIVVIFAIAGVGYLVASHAASTTTAYTSTNQFSSFTYVPPVAPANTTVAALTHANSTNLELQFNKGVTGYQASDTAYYELTLPANTVGNSLTMNVSYVNNGYNTDFVSAGAYNNVIWKVNTASSKTDQSVTINLSSHPTAIYFGINATGSAGGFSGTFPANRYFIVNSYTLTGTTTTTTTTTSSGSSGSSGSSSTGSSSSSGSVLFNGSQLSTWQADGVGIQICETGNYIKMVNDPVTGASDNTIQMYANDGASNGDCGDATERSQLSGPGNVLSSGGTYWMTYNVYIPQASGCSGNSCAFPSDVAGLILNETGFGEPYTGSPLEFQANDGDFRLQQGTGASVPYQVMWQEPFTANQWTQVTEEFNFASSGWVQLYINGVRQSLYDGPDVLASDDSSASAHYTTQAPVNWIFAGNEQGPWDLLLNDYGGGGVPSVTVDYKGYCIATTQSASESCN